MGYEDTIGWMFNLERFGIKLGLDNFREFLAKIGNPHESLSSLHVAGTNGKGSVCAFAAEILKTHGLKTGLYISPHLVDFRERITISGEMISETDVVRYADELKSTMESMAHEDPEKQLTFFEFTTGLALHYFRDKKVDIIVAEVGMGGRLDATNVLIPLAAAITRIDLEHTSYLGKTLLEIAREKAGVIKPGIPVVTCEKDEQVLHLIESTCEKNGAEMLKLGTHFKVQNVRQALDGTSFDYSGVRRLNGLRTRMLGSYQAENAAAAITLVESIRGKHWYLPEEEIREGVVNTKWPGRIEIVSSEPLLIFDGSHNPDGARITMGTLRDLGVTPVKFVVACMDDKNYDGIVSELAPFASEIFCTKVRNRRALNPELLAQAARSRFSGEVRAFETSEEALSHAYDSSEDRGVCVIGSLYLVGEAIQWWRKRAKESVGCWPHKV